MLRTLIAHRFLIRESQPPERVLAYWQMNLRAISFFCLALTLPAVGQNGSPNSPTEAGLPKNPRALFAAVTPFYDFDDAEMKPWHLKASYQLYDSKSNPTQEGSYEYWWISPKIDLSSWTRPGTSFMIWHTADGNRHYQVTGDHVSPFEINLTSELVFKVSDLHLANLELSGIRRKWNGRELACVQVSPSFGYFSSAQARTSAWRLPTYCFDSVAGALVGYTSTGFDVEYNGIVKMHGRFLPEQVTVLVNGNKALVARVNSIEDLDPAKQAPIPSPTSDRQRGPLTLLVPGDLGSPILKPDFPIIRPFDSYPAGVVVLEVTVDQEGNVTAADVLSTPDVGLETELRSQFSTGVIIPISWRGSRLRSRRSSKSQFRAHCTSLKALRASFGQRKLTTSAKVTSSIPRALNCSAGWSPTPCRTTIPNPSRCASDRGSRHK